MSAEHVASAAAIHCQALPDDLIPRLGAKFAERQLYRRVVELPSAIGYVYILNGRVVGYVTATLDPSFYHYSLSEKAIIPYLLLPAFVRRPSLVRDLLDTMRFARAKEQLPYLTSEIASVGVLPECRTPEFFRAHGVNIARQLNVRVLRELRQRGIPEVFGIFRPENALAVVAYQNLGFTRRDEFSVNGSRRVVLGCALQTDDMARRLAQEPA